MGRLSALASAFGDDGSDMPPGDCPKLRPAALPRASCPGVGPEVEMRRREGSNVCPPQPPACCEAARRAEAAAKMVSDSINGHPLLRWFQMSSMPEYLAALPPPPLRVEKATKQQKERDSLSDFL
eukprot:TRINITY_DN5232_c0_g1_i1.p1 TRINITY_DN5232_c0_g1~~TRINITY_DN5232_c0_g1_i1.p1  ORF type:complete len:125 (+),score=23.00 TRINITY_DN5232_c0_g1_i1:65-439(+)